jgi:hypothetical protein
LSTSLARVSGRHAAIALALIAACGTPGRNPGQNDPAPAPAAGAEHPPTPAKAIVITEFDQLAAADGKEVTVVGTYRLHDPVPHLRREPPFYLSAITFEGEIKPRLFLQLPRPAGEQEKLDGTVVRVVGTFHRTQPRPPGDPPHSATFGGSWLYDIKALEPHAASGP